MVELPWRGSDVDTDESDDTDPDEHADAIVTCAFQDGTLAVYEDEVVITRVPRSKFVGKTIPTDEIAGVTYESGITVGYIQIEQTAVGLDSGGLFSDPVDENTLHFQRSGRDCATEARDAILERATG
jgi:hypothetical protein